MDDDHEAANVQPVPATELDRGFRLLVLREFHVEKEPPAFAVIEQRLLRWPQRPSRHGFAFANAFLPDVVAWLGEHLGRASQRDTNDRPRRNPRWPVIAWHGEQRQWSQGVRTTEWFAEIVFADDDAWMAFRQRWNDRLVPPD